MLIKGCNIKFVLSMYLNLSFKTKIKSQEDFETQPTIQISENEVLL